MAYDTPYRPKDNTGSIFKNDRKEKETQPDGKGSAVIDGVDYWVSSWNATDKNGNPYRKLGFTRKEQAAPAPAPRQAPKPSHDAFKARQLEGRTADRSMPHKDAYGEQDSDVPF